MDDIVVFKTADDVDDGVDFPDMGQELVPEALALGRPFDETGDVHEFDGRRHDGFRMVELCQQVEPLVRDSDDADVRFDRAERVVRGLCARVGNGIEERTFPDVGKPDDTKFHR